MDLSPHVSCLTKEIATLCDPEKIYLFNAKRSLAGNVTSFKLCIIADTESKAALERRIYLELDCEIPYDLVLYTPNEWGEFLQKPHSFAGEIKEKGVLLYDKAQTSE
ncbi:MAG: hypothetical protein ACOX6P_09140 [Candidatus Merdivicinus sp.]|jgi:hypothetical protein